MVIRTVFDARPSAGRKYAMQTALLAASWCHYVKDRSAHPLEVIVIGEPPATLDDWLRDLRVRVTRVGPHANDGLSRLANKILGLLVGGEPPVLLVDNDTCFVGDLDDVRAPAGVDVMAAAAGFVRVSEAQWRYIRERLRLEPLDFEWQPLVEQVASFQKGTPSAVRRDLYVNSGVVWTANPGELGRLWAENVKRIGDLFDGHPLSSASVRGDDQVGLAAAIGTHDKFAWLDDGLNYRPPCFWMGKGERAEIWIVHMTAMTLADLGQTCTVEEVVRKFWDDRVRSGVVPLDDPRRGRLLRTSEDVLAAICDVISTFELNRMPF